MSMALDGPGLAELAYPENQEFSWLATDHDGRLGAFSAFLSGPIPIQVFAYPDPDGRACVEERLLTLLPPRRSAVRNVARAGSLGIDLAERGVFVFEYDFGTRSSTYEPVVAPIAPILVVEICYELQEIALATRFSSLSFAEDPFIDVRHYFRCVESVLHGPTPRRPTP